MKAVYAVPAVIAIVGRAYAKKSLTPAGLVAATLTAIVHAWHPWPLPFVLLGVFFFAGTRVTHVKENVKAKLTIPSNGAAGGEGPRTHIQVLANSGVATVLSILHTIQLKGRTLALSDPMYPQPNGSLCYSWGGDLFIIGIIANYAAVAADTFSSELGILSKGDPRLITSWTLRKVPRGTNGGVSLLGLGAGLLGSLIIVTASLLFLPLCTPATAALPGGGAPWSPEQRRIFMVFMVVWGALGSVADSLLGGWFQRSVIDVRSGKIVEGEGGGRVLVSGPDEVVVGSLKRAEAKAAMLNGEGKDAVEKTDASAVDDSKVSSHKYDAKDKHRRPSFGDERPSRIVETGWNLLDNNDVNFLMAVLMSTGAMAVAAWYWDIEPRASMVP